MKKIINLTESDLYRIVKRILNEEETSNDSVVEIFESPNVSQLKICVTNSSTKIQKCTNHKVEVCYSGHFCSKIKIKDPYFSLGYGFEAKVKPSADSGYLIQKSFETLLDSWIKDNGYLLVYVNKTELKKPLEKMKSSSYPITVDAGYGVSIKIM